MPRLLILAIFTLLFSSPLFSRPLNLAVKDTVDSKKNEVKEAKDTSAVDTTIMITPEVVVVWSEKNSVGLNLNEVAFVNWNAGGNNSISAMLYGQFERKYQKKLTLWKSDVSAKIGINSQEGRELRKTEDNIQLNSTFGYRTDSTSHWRYSAKFNFNTQLAEGYQYPNTSKPISKFMAPGYIFLGVGAEFTDPIEDLTVYVSPLTEKSTFVLDQTLANEGMFGVTPAKRDANGILIEKGEKVRTEVGILVTSAFSKTVFENIDLKTKISLYTDYIQRFGNIDVDWELALNFTVNDFVKATVGTHLKYDDDVKYKEDTNGDGKLETLGPRLQIKQMLGVGIIYEF